ASYDHTVRIWDATPLTGDPLAPHCVTLAGHQEKVSEVAFSPDGKWLASASLDGTANVWELLGRPGPITLPYTLRGHSGHVVGVAFSPDNQTIASLGRDDAVKLWDLQAPERDSLRERERIRLTRSASSLGFSPDGGLLAIGQRNGIALYDPATANEAHPFKP